MKKFGDYSIGERDKYITLSGAEYYPDYLADAKILYMPVLVAFRQILEHSESSVALLKKINNSSVNAWMRIQLMRVFRKYVAPDLPVEMLKKKGLESSIITNYSSEFRKISLVHNKFAERGVEDDVLFALRWEYKDRGKKGYSLTEKFFSEIETKFPDLSIWGPKGAGPDVQANSIWGDYVNLSRPLDFVISSKDKKIIYAVGLARYDGDRGGAQEDDRTGGYKNCADEILGYIHKKGLKTKIIFVNDGPGLLLGTMWNDYSALEDRYPNEIMVLTLRMIEERLTRDWLLGEE